MGRWCRLFSIYVSAFFREKILLTDMSHLSFRVWPQEADKKYMNNASFWMMTEMGQMDLFFRSGLLKLCRRHGWYPLVGSQKIVYTKPLKRFERFELKSMLVYWEDKWAYLKQTFYKNGQMVANSLIKVIIKKKDGYVPLPQIFTALGIETNPPHEKIIDHSEKIDDILLEKNKVTS